MILHSDREGNDCIWKLRCHCIQIMHSDIYSVYLVKDVKCLVHFTLRTKKNKKTIFYKDFHSAPKKTSCFVLFHSFAIITNLMRL